MQNQNFGKKGTDQITGFHGIITAYCEYITGCGQYLITPTANGNDFKEGRWFDETRISVGETVPAAAAIINPGNNDGPGESAPVK